MPAEPNYLPNGSIKKQLKAGSKMRGYNPTPVNTSGLMPEETRGVIHTNLDIIAKEVNALLKYNKKSTVKAEYIDFIVERLGLDLSNAEDDYIPKSPLIRLLKTKLGGKYNVTADAGNTLHIFVNNLVFTLGYFSALNADSHKRKTIFPRDMQVATKTIKETTYELDECDRKCILDRFVR